MNGSLSGQSQRLKSEIPPNHNTRRRRNRRRSYFVGLFLVVIVTDGSRESYSDHHHVQFRFTVIAQRGTYIFEDRQIDRLVQMFPCLKLTRCRSRDSHKTIIPSTLHYTSYIRAGGPYTRRPRYLTTPTILVCGDSNGFSGKRFRSPDYYHHPLLAGCLSGATITHLLLRLPHNLPHYIEHQCLAQSYEDKLHILSSRFLHSSSIHCRFVLHFNLQLMELVFILLIIII